MATKQETGSTEPGAGGGGVYTSFVRWMENLGETGFAYFLLTPPLLLLALIAFWPLIETFRLSLFAVNPTNGQSSFVGLELYTRILSGEVTSANLAYPFFPPELTLSGLFGGALTLTLMFTVISVFFETLIGFGQALVLNQDFRGRRWVRVAIIIPWAIPIVVQGMIFFLLFQPDIGLLVGTTENPALLNQLGLLSTTPLANAQDTTLIVVVADIWKTTAFMALLILAGLQSVDRSLYDVAKVAGATPWQRFRYITFPIVLPTILVAMLFRTIQAMRVYGIIDATGGCGVAPSLSCLVVDTFNRAATGAASATAFITAAIIAVVVSVYIAGYAREDI